VEHSDGARRPEQRGGREESAGPRETGGLGGVADAGLPAGRESDALRSVPAQTAAVRDCGCSDVGVLADVLGEGLEGQPRHERDTCEPGRVASRAHGPVAESGAPSGVSGAAGRPGWAEFDILPCRDGKARRVEAGTFPLADGVPGRVGLLRGYGNGIVAQVAEAFVRAWMDCRASDGGGRASTAEGRR
jgi:DNA (cytosine-5)-methyltransferase 1